ncbi:protein of unknown function (plasmid) [Cupriavidus taiwanensis]|uniref:Uncharacterized protein n=1 Tax=Cupriavidus taiwanensis TaxID=164546 RepID=A0A375IN33_9BURK|nr:protein of unknown function [Cupriavidus taiwanensis]
MTPNVFEGIHSGSALMLANSEFVVELLLQPKKIPALHTKGGCECNVITIRMRALFAHAS